MKTTDFRKVYAHRQEFKEGRLLLKIGVQKSTASRLGVVVSKKVAKQAVRRNRIRRVLKEAMRLEMETMKGLPAGRQGGQDLVLIVLPGFDPKNFQGVKKIIHQLLSKASLPH